MKPSEELMLLLELNKFDITRFRLKKQLEYEDTGNIDLYRHKTYADLVISHYLYDDSLETRHKNPLTYNQTWDNGINSLSQFYVNHPDINKEVTLGDFLLQESANDISKESILKDVIYVWVEEHKESNLTKMENLREMLILLPKKSKTYKKHSKVAFFFAILSAVFLLLFYVRPSLLQPSSINFIANYVQDWNNLVSDIPWYNFLGILSIFLFVFYAVLNNVFSRKINNVKDIKKRKANKLFVKWEKEMGKSRAKQLKILNAYVDSVLEDPTRSSIELKKLNGPEVLMTKYKKYVQVIEHKYDYKLHQTHSYFKITFLCFTHGLYRIHYSGICLD